MADDWFAGKGGDDANSGATWPLRKLTIDGVGGLLSVGYAAGDSLIVGPGVYREDVTLGIGGGSAYSTGTVSVTNESRTVTGAGTFFQANVDVGDLLFIGGWRSKADGATAGGVLEMTSATGAFEPNMAGYMVEIMDRDAYVISAATPPTATKLTLVDVNSMGNPVVGAGLTYYIQSGEGPYEVASIESDTELTLVKPWSGPTLTTLEYVAYSPVSLIGDTTGVLTDGVGGRVMLYGSDDDETRVQLNGIYADTKNYWLIRGFDVVCFADYGIWFEDCTYITIEDCVIHDCQDFPIEFDSSTQITVRRCHITGNYGNTGVYAWGGAGGTANSQCLVDSCYIGCGANAVIFQRQGGATVKNMSLGFGCYIGVYASTMNVVQGMALFVHDCALHFVNMNAALVALNLGELVEQSNNFWNNSADRNPNVGTALNSTTYASLPTLPLLTGRTRNPMTHLAAPSQWDQTAYQVGLYGANMDLFGIHNEVAQTRRSKGAIHAYATVRDEQHMYGAFIGSLYMPDAAEQQFCYPVRENWDYDISVQVRLGSSYAGNNPDMVIQQPGQADVVATSTGASSVWEQLSAQFTTGPDLDFIFVTIRSHNMSTLINRAVEWQDLQVN